MTKVTMPSGNYLLVEVPEVNIRKEFNKLVWGTERYGTFSKPLPPGQWSIIGRPNEILLNDEWLKALAENNCKTSTTLILKLNP